ncbi:MAG TPA: ABC transporter ATP-binding protein [Candidatus Kapabacteria bacterium]|nr:ABC transporter ATP-binding protein [Candidatus Kapabacteria bacterium]
MKTLLTLLPYFKRYKSKYIWGILFTLFSAITQALVPWYLGAGVNSIQSATATSSSIVLYCLLVVGLSALSGYLFYLVRQTIIVASRRVEYDLRNDFLKHILTLSMRYFQNTPQGEVMAYATNDINAVRNFVGPAIMYGADTISTFVCSLILMLLISPKLTLISLAPLPLMSIAVYMIGRRSHPLFDAVQAHYADITARATESISGSKVVKAYVREDFEQQTFDELSNGYYLKNMRLQKIQGLMMPAIFCFVGLSITILLFFGAPELISGSLKLGDVSRLIMYLGMLTWPFIGIGFVSGMVQRAVASMDRLNKVFDTKPDVSDSEITNRSVTSINGDIEFRNVSFRYRDELPLVLRNINLRIPRGHTLAIIGKTGSGKSSFVQLIPRLYDVSEGEILIDGKDIRTIPVEVLRENIGMVQQESFLFSEALHDNISYSVESPETNAILNAARSAEIYKDIADFPQGFETMVGERGITLSGGQKQRTALARAIARDPKILILDDAMSAVDTATEERILGNLRNIMRGRTSIIISHRISTVKDADEIIVIDNGVIAERGSHSELLDQRGAYHDLYRKQLLEEALENA